MIPKFQKTDYDIRKKQTEKIADKYLSDNKIYKYSDRKHDIADALCQVLYYVTINKVVDVYIPDDIDNFLLNAYNSIVGNKIQIAEIIFLNHTIYF